MVLILYSLYSIEYVHFQNHVKSFKNQNSSMKKTMLKSIHIPCIKIFEMELRMIILYTPERYNIFNRTIFLYI